MLPSYCNFMEAAAVDLNQDCVISPLWSSEPALRKGRRGMIFFFNVLFEVNIFGLQPSARHRSVSVVAMVLVSRTVISRMFVVVLALPPAERTIQFECLFSLSVRCSILTLVQLVERLTNLLGTRLPSAARTV